MNRTIQRTFEILDYAADNPEGVCLKDITDAMELSKSSAYVIVQSLLELGYLEPCIQNSKRYTLGVSAYTLGMQYISKIDFISLITPELKKLTDKWNRPGFAGILKGGKTIYVNSMTPSGSLLRGWPAGTSKEAHATDIGKVIIANRPDRNALLENLNLTRITEHTITDKDIFLKEIQKTKKNGFALDDEESENALTSIAVPIFDSTGIAIAAMSIMSLSSQKSDLDEIKRDLKEAAMNISTKLGSRNLI